MQSSLLDDTKRKELEDEYLNSQTDEFRRAVVARIIVEDILKRVKPKLLARLNDGEQLSDRELAILAYSGDVDERLQKQLVDRQITQYLGDKYIEEFIGERVSKQLALQTVKETFDIGLTITKVGWSAIKSGIQSASGATLRELFAQPVPAQYWKINFAAAGVFVMVDLVHSLYLWNKGKITGKDLAKRMTSSLASNGLAIGGGHIGCVIGTYLGLLVGPVGAVIGGIIGGALGGLAFSFIGTWLNERIWRLLDSGDEEKAREEVIKSARKTLEILEADNFKIITQKWRSKVIQYHPDKNMNATEEEKKWFGIKFQEVHAAYLVLREEEKRRGKLSDDQIKKISKSTAIMVLNDGWLDD